MSGVLVVAFFVSFVINSLVVCDTIESLGSKSVEEITHEPKVCSELSICNSTMSPMKRLYRCMCDSNCSFYGDCCSESPYYNFSVRLNSRKSDVFSCPKKFGFYVINKCPPEFADQDVKGKCENISIDRDYKDKQIMKPVLEKASRITYLNAYCALCNGVTDFEKFRLGYECNVVNSSIKVTDKENLKNLLRNAKFNYETKEVTSSLNGTDYVCSHTVITPIDLEPYLRYCEPKMISSCPKAFNDSKIVEACNSRTYAVYTNPFIGYGDIYKNIDCAKCNGVNSTSIRPCQTPPFQAAQTSSGASTLFLSPSVVHYCDEPELREIPVCSDD